MDTVNEILTTDKQSVDIRYLDFQKAFDSAPHKRLMNKPKAHGITGKTHAIVKDFLSDRGFKVRVGSTCIQDTLSSRRVARTQPLGRVRRASKGILHTKDQHTQDISRFHLVFPRERFLAPCSSLYL